MKWRLAFKPQADRDITIWVVIASSSMEVVWPFDFIWKAL